MDRFSGAARPPEKNNRIADLDMELRRIDAALSALKARKARTLAAYRSEMRQLYPELYPSVLLSLLLLLEPVSRKTSIILSNLL